MTFAKDVYNSEPSFSIMESDTLMLDEVVEPKKGSRMKQSGVRLQKEGKVLEIQ